MSKIVYASGHCLTDSNSGAAIATLRALWLLADLRFDCHAFCGSRLDAPAEGLVAEMIASHGWPYEVRNVSVETRPARLLFADVDGVAATMFLSASTQRNLHGGELEVFLAAFDRFLQAAEPDAVVSYGGDEATQAMIRLAKARSIPVVFCLHNFSYSAAEAFLFTDYVVVPSAYSSARHMERLGLLCHVLPNVIESGAMWVTEWRPTYVTFVNPVPAKGIYVLFRVASELARRRPDIPLLVVEGRGQVEVIRREGVDLVGLGNVTVIPNTPRAATFYEETKVMLVPSLWEESFGLVAAEALSNGIPVLASDRGALPETVGDGGFLFNIPARYTPQTTDVPTAEEVEPWVETILRLWDDPQEYATASERARSQAQRWHPDRLAPLYREFFSNLTPQPFPPLAPPGVR